MQGPLEADFEGGHVCTDHLLQRALIPGPVSIPVTVPVSIPVTIPYQCYNTVPVLQYRTSVNTSYNTDY